MKKISVELSADYEVAFAVPHKAEAFFIESAWKDSFFDFNDLEDVSEHIIMTFHNSESETIDGDKCMHLEGFPVFKCSLEHSDLWRAHSVECGSIVIKVCAELYCGCVEEV